MKSYHFIIVMADYLDDYIINSRGITFLTCVSVCVCRSRWWTSLVWLRKQHVFSAHWSSDQTKDAAHQAMLTEFISGSKHFKTH